MASCAATLCEHLRPSRQPDITSRARSGRRYQRRMESVDAVVTGRPRNALTGHFRRYSASGPRLRSRNFRRAVLHQPSRLLGTTWSSSSPHLVRHAAAGEASHSSATRWGSVRRNTIFTATRALACRRLSQLPALAAAQHQMARRPAPPATTRSTRPAALASTRVARRSKAFRQHVALPDQQIAAGARTNP